MRVLLLVLLAFSASAVEKVFPSKYQLPYGSVYMEVFEDKRCIKATLNVALLNYRGEFNTGLWEELVEYAWSTSYFSYKGEPVYFELDVEFRPSVTGFSNGLPANASVELKDSGRNYMNSWNRYYPQAVHEIGHWLGVHDEYPEALVHDRLGWITRGTLMSSNSPVMCPNYYRLFIDWFRQKYLRLGPISPREIGRCPGQSSNNIEDVTIVPGFLGDGTKCSEL